MTRLRHLIRGTAPAAVEEWKWNSPTWSQDGLLLVSVSAFRKHVGINFFQGASLRDPEGLFNGGLESKQSRSINIFDGGDIDDTAFSALVGAAAEHNTRNASS